MLPDIGNVEEAEVTEICVSTGQKVGADDTVIVIESDKASMEVPAGAEGIVSEIQVAIGDLVNEGSIIGVLNNSTTKNNCNEDNSLVKSPSSIEEDDPDPVVETQEEEETISSNNPVNEEVRVTEGSLEPGQGASQERNLEKKKDYVLAGPSARKLARELGVALEEVNVIGSGGRGRVTTSDVKEYAKTKITKVSKASSEAVAFFPGLPEVDFSKFGEVEKIPLSRIQKQVAINMRRSWLNIPHVTQHCLADIEDLEKFRKSLSEEAQQLGIRLSPLPFVIKAVCQALGEHPKLNGSLSVDGESFVMKHFINIGIAVDTPDGLIVPVIREADRLGIWDLSQKVAKLAEASRSKKVSIDDLSGSTFTISNLGNLGGSGFTPIINPPEVAILGIGKSSIQPVWDGEQFLPKNQLPLSLSYDHRAINGAEGGGFLATLAKILSDIRRLSL